MEPQKSNVDEFFEKLPNEDKEEADIFAENPKAEEKKADSAAEDADDPEKAPESVKDRRHRRLEARLQQEREANIELNAIIKTRSEMERFAQEVGDDINPDIAKMFDATDVGKENALRLSKVILDSQKRAKEEAIREIEEKQANAVKEQREYESLIDNELESLEDDYNVDLTSDSPKARKTRREFLELVQELSPKDEEGNITGYADFGSTFKMYQKTHTEKTETNTRREEIASRSMQRSNAGSETVKKITSGFDGWKKDYGV